MSEDSAADKTFDNGAGNSGIDDSVANHQQDRW